MRARSSGFTLVELVVAVTIGAFIAMVAVGALRTVTAGAEIVNANIDTAAEVKYASQSVARDLTNLYRDAEAESMRLVGAAVDVGSSSDSILTFYTVGRVKARPDQPESDVYEVEYYLLRDEDESILCRRLWPYPDEELEEPGGVVTVIAENIDVFEVRYYDGTEWSNEWTEEMATIPDLIEVNIASSIAGTDRLITDSFMINFARMVSQQAESEAGGGEEEAGEEGAGQEQQGETGEQTGESVGGGVREGGAIGIGGGGAGGMGTRGGASGAGTRGGAGGAGTRGGAGGMGTRGGTGGTGTQGRGGGTGTQGRGGGTGTQGRGGGTGTRDSGGTGTRGGAGGTGTRGGGGTGT